MTKVIMIGCDLHDRSMLLRYAVGTCDPQQLSFDNDARGRALMVGRLKSLAKKNHVDRIVFAYEASGLGYGLCDMLLEEGIECHVLSPNQLPKTPKSAKLKTDAKDAQMILEQVRGFVLAGNSLPVVWTPPQRLRDDRELVRARIDAGDEMTRIKLKILSMLKRREIVKPTWYTSRWSKRFITWLREEVVVGLDSVVAAVLEKFIDRFELFQMEQVKLDKAIRELSHEARYKHPHAALRKIPGVGLLSAMTFLTEMGDLTRFHNRREVAAYLGLCPSSHESGETNNRKGRITRQGPSRLRKLLCQAAWVSVRDCAQAQAAYHRIKQGQSKRTKKSLVALMRKLGIKMWHQALACGVSCELTGRGGPHEVKASGRAQQRDTVEPSASPSHRPSFAG
jgi:transposase